MKQEKRTISENVIHLCRYVAPCGELVIGTVGDSLCLCDWADGARHSRTMDTIARLLWATYAEGETPIAAEAIRQLDGYFTLRLQEFRLPLLAVGTPFQQQVWRELRRIPYATTISYSGQARRMGIGQAVRAVAAANGANPLSVIIPCHRVIGADGSLTGYGGGMERKRWLLDMESRWNGDFLDEKPCKCATL